MGRRVLVVSMVLAGLAFASGARAYDLVRVLSGNRILVTADGRQLSLVLAGISVPAPPGADSAGEYRGLEAREFLAKLLLRQGAFIREVEPLRPEASSVRVLIRVGANGEQDLAMVMAEAGLALADRAAGADPDHLAAIRAAEKEARLAHRGIHDGGHQAFMNGAGRTIDFGVGTLSGDKPKQGYAAYLDDVATGNTRTKTSTDPCNGIHCTGVAAIRDWGSSMGLPPDSSAIGY